MSPGGSGGGSQNLANLTVSFVLQGQQALQQAIAAVQQQTQQVMGAVQALGSQLAGQMAAVQSKVAAAGAAIGQLAKATAAGAAEMKSGFDRLVTAVGQFHFDFLNRADAVNKKTGEMKKGVEGLGAAFEKLGHTVNLALGAALAPVANFVRQGLAAGAMGQVLQFQMERLALSISGLFRPEIERVIGAVEKLTGWLSRLTEAQRATVARWVEGAAAALAVSLIFPKVAAAVQGLAAAFRGLLASTGIGSLLPVLGLVAQGLTAILVGTEKGRDAIYRLGEAIKPLGDALADAFKALGPDLQVALDGTIETIRSLSVVIQGVAEQVRGLTAALDRLSGSEGTLGKLWKYGTPAGLITVVSEQFNRALEQAGLLQPAKPQTEHGSRAPDLRRPGGFEALEATYRRIAQASVRATSGARSPEERTAQNTEAAIPILGSIVRGLQNVKVIMGR